MSKTTLIAVVLVALMVGGIGWTWYAKTLPGKLDSFAACLKDKKVIFYGAFWCPHCQETKKEFGNSAKLLPYVECSTADGRGQLEVCRAAGVTGYPTWVFPDGKENLTGKRELTELAERSGCVLPQ
jgi:thiol-disulfide isomerase/thioredoxin